MKTYFLKVPFTGVMEMAVDAGSEEEAFDKAMAADVTLVAEEGPDGAHDASVREWGFRRAISKGFTLQFDHANQITVASVENYDDEIDEPPDGGHAGGR